MIVSCWQETQCSVTAFAWRQGGHKEIYIVRKKHGPSDLAVRSDHAWFASLTTRLARAAKRNEYEQNNNKKKQKRNFLKILFENLNVSFLKWNSHLNSSVIFSYPQLKLDQSYIHNKTVSSLSSFPKIFSWI